MIIKLNCILTNFSSPLDPLNKNAQCKCWQGSSHVPPYHIMGTALYHRAHVVLVDNHMHGLTKISWVKNKLYHSKHFHDITNIFRTWAYVALVHLNV